MNCRSRILDLSVLNRDNERPRFTNKLVTAVRKNRAKRNPVVGKSTLPGMMTVFPFILIVVLCRMLRDPRTRKVRGPNCYFVTFWWNNIHNTECASSGFVHPFGINLKNSVLKGLLITASFAQKYFSHWIVHIILSVIWGWQSLDLKSGCPATASCVYKEAVKLGVKYV